MIEIKKILEERKKLFYDELKKYKTNNSKGLDTFVSKTNDLFVFSNLALGPNYSSFDAKTAYGLKYDEILKRLSSTFIASKKKLKDKELDIIKDTTLSIKPVELEVDLDRKININLEKQIDFGFYAINSKFNKINLIDNPKIPKEVDSVVEDKLKAVEAIKILEEYKYDNYYITKIFSASLLGKDKRFVPTRQAITAIDDILGKQNIEKIKEYETIKEIYMYKNEFLHNLFYIFLIPGKWSYEQFEFWQSNDWNIKGYDYNHEFELYNGRKKYASFQAGGYYAARYAVTEYLKQNEIQAKVLVLRFIKKDYSLPVGVWQVRENVKNAFKNKPFVFQNLNTLKEFLKTLPNKDFIKKSVLISQKSLLDFFG